MSDSKGLSLEELRSEGVDDLLVVLVILHFAYVQHQLFSSSYPSPATPVLYVFLPLDIFFVYFFFGRWVRRIGNLAVAVVSILASLSGVLMSVFIAYIALTTSRDPLAQGCLFAVSTILLGEVFYVRRLITSRARSIGGINGTAT